MSLSLLFFLSISFYIIKNDADLKSGYEKLINLKWIRLDNNQLSGEIPKEVQVL